MQIYKFENIHYIILEKQNILNIKSNNILEIGMLEQTTNFLIEN